MLTDAQLIVLPGLLALAGASGHSRSSSATTTASQTSRRASSRPVPRAGVLVARRVDGVERGEDLADGELDGKLAADAVGQLDAPDSPHQRVLRPVQVRRCGHVEQRSNNRARKRSRVTWRFARLRLFPARSAALL